MRNKFFILSLLILLITAAPFFAATTTYKIDAAHSNIGFSVPIMSGLSQVRGKFTDFTVTIVYDDKDVTKSSVEAVIKAASINTGIEARDKHLRTADFFDAEKFPDITFKSTRIVKKGKGFIAEGTFTMHGVSKAIALPFNINGISTDPKTGKTSLGATARIVVNRSDYGINYTRADNPNFVGNMIDIELNLITRLGTVQ